jgi:hypothetical protein
MLENVYSFSARPVKDRMAQCLEIAFDSASTTPLLWHIGELDGHSSGVFLRSQDRIGIVVLQNLGTETGGRAIEQFGDWLMRLTRADVSRCRH